MDSDFFLYFRIKLSYFTNLQNNLPCNSFNFLTKLSILILHILLPDVIKLMKCLNVKVSVY